MQYDDVLELMEGQARRKPKERRRKFDRDTLVSYSYTEEFEDWLEDDEADAPRRSRRDRAAEARRKLRRRANEFEREF